MTDAQAGPSRSSVVMSLKRMPSVGKSLISRIFFRSSETSMPAGMLPAGPGRRNTKNLLGQRSEIRDHEVRVRRRPTEARGVVGGPHPDAPRAQHVGVRVVSDV